MWGYTMSKSILIGNGFTSQLIPDYLDPHMKEKLLQYCRKDYLDINELFENFRITDYSYKDVYSQNGNIFNNSKIEENIIDVLNKIGFQNCTDMFNIYFRQYGLISEVIKNDISSIENLLKVIDLFKKIGKMDKEKETKIKQIANKIYYNEGKYGLKDTILANSSKIVDFFKDFDFVFTTNYDLIIDDSCENKDKVFHLHGGFNIIKVINIGNTYYEKTDERLTDEVAHIIWGVNGVEKLKYMEAGLTFPFTFPISFPESLFNKYFDKLENENIQEIYVFGYSGENDQHITCIPTSIITRWAMRFPMFHKVPFVA